MGVRARINAATLVMYLDLVGAQSCRARPLDGVRWSKAITLYAHQGDETRKAGPARHRA